MENPNKNIECKNKEKGCDEKFTKKSNMVAHSHNSCRFREKKSVNCPICHNPLKNSVTLKKHLKVCGKKKKVQCERCLKFFDSAHLKRHQISCSLKCQKCEFRTLDDKDS